MSRFHVLGRAYGIQASFPAWRISGSVRVRQRLYGASVPEPLSYMFKALPRLFSGLLSLEDAPQSGMVMAVR